MLVIIIIFISYPGSLMKKLFLEKGNDHLWHAAAMSAKMRTEMMIGFNSIKLIVDLDKS